MKRLVRSKSGRQIYGQKWQNIDRSNESNSDDDLHSASVVSTGNDVAIPITEISAESPAIAATGTGSRLDMESMYRASLVGDWVAAEKILARVPNLAHDYVTEEGDRALHVAAAMKHKKFVEKLVQRISRKDLALIDGRGYTACWYAALSGEVEIARLMIDKNPDLVTLHDESNTTPLHKAAWRGRTKMVSYFLDSIKVEDLSTDEWFDLLLFTIRREMYGVAIEIVRKNEYLATMANKDGTALDLLARHELSNASNWLSVFLDVFFGIHNFSMNVLKKRSDFGVLAKKLWIVMRRLEKDRVLELIQKHNLLHEAAKAGHVEIVTMLTRTYPQLIWDTDSSGYTIFHIAVKYRRYNVYNLIHHVGAKIDLSAISQDQNGDNILHLAAKLEPLSRIKRIPQSFLQMQSEISWFKDVEATVPPSCRETKNEDGKTPRELFSNEHKSLMEKSETWMRNTADSCMLIGTILLTVVFAAAFTLPGGTDDESGGPLLEQRILFKTFIAFEVLALFGSLFSIIMFLSIMTSNFAEDKFQYILPWQLGLGLGALLSSILFAISAFMDAIFLTSNTALFWYRLFVSAFFFIFLIATLQFVSLGEMTTIVPTWIRNRWSRRTHLFTTSKT